MPEYIVEENEDEDPRDCPSCRGSGYNESNGTCGTCSGSGRREDDYAQAERHDDYWS